MAHKDHGHAVRQRHFLRLFHTSSQCPETGHTQCFTDKLSAVLPVLHHENLFLSTRPRYFRVSFSRMTTPKNFISVSAGVLLLACAGSLCGMAQRNVMKQPTAAD